MKAVSKILSIVSLAILSDRIGSAQGTSAEMFSAMEMNHNDHRLLASSTVAKNGVVQPKFTIPPVSTDFELFFLTFFRFFLFRK